MSETKDTTIKFVNLILKHKDRKWQLSQEEVQILSDLLTTAGFEPEQIYQGKLQDWDFELPYVVVDQFGVNLFATGWLSDACMLVLSGGYRGYKKPLIDQLMREVERSAPLTPIQLTGNGHYLVETRPQRLSQAYEYFVDHTRDSDLLLGWVGNHHYCHGGINRRRATEKEDALVCSACFLRVEFPREIQTYGELRHFLSDRFKVLS